MRVIIYSQPDGGVDIIYPSPWAWMPGESDADFLVRIHDRDVPDWALESHIVDRAHPACQPSLPRCLADILLPRGD